MTHTGPHKALTEFRNCWEASMTFEEALGCAGLAGKPADLIEVLRQAWNGWEQSFSAECCAQEYLVA